jgi:membrane-associated phospholipid phosphatase
MNKIDKANEQEETTWLACAGIILMYMIPYGIVNHLPLNRSIIPFLPGEALIPFLPWTFIIYISVFIQGLIIIRAMPRRMMKKAMMFAGGMVFAALMLFLFFPIEYPRMLYATDNWLINLFRATDGPGNCFPSLHVAITILLAFCYTLVEKSTWKKVFMWVWTIAICISVLTTKQHYIIDVLGGIAISIPCMYFVNRYCK